MKQLPLLSFSLLFVICVNAQSSKKDYPKPINISLSGPVLSSAYFLGRADYDVIFEDIPEGTHLDIAIIKNLMSQPKLKFQTEEDAKNTKTLKDTEGTLAPIKLKIRANTVYTITVTISLKDKLKEVRTYTFKSDSSWSWTTTFGINAVFLLNSDTYKTMVADDKFIIVGDGGQKILNYMPSVMFSFMDQSKNIQWGFTGGLGFDLQKISTFAGISLGFGQNIILTGGLAFHQQQRLNSIYENGQIVDASLSFDDIHNEYYRFNPFVSISFRLDKSPFSKP